MAVTLHLSITNFATGTAATASAPVVLEVQTANFDAEQVLNIGSQSSGAGAGKVTFNPFSITRRPDANSATFWAFLCAGTTIRNMTLTATNAGATDPFMTFTMGLVAVKTFAVNASEAGDAIETVTFEYGQGTYGAAAVSSTGTIGKVITSGWDVTKNVKV